LANPYVPPRRRGFGRSTTGCASSAARRLSIAGDLPHLLAGIRVGCIEDPIRRSDALRRVHRIRRLREQKETPE
jgi:hypothetical protein